MDIQFIPNFSEGHSFLPLFIVIALAFVVPVLLSQIKKWLALPVVVGEILLGIVLGQLDPTLIHDPVLEIISEIGFGILFFLAGTEIDFTKLRMPSKQKDVKGIISRISSPIPLGILSFVATLALAAIFTFILERTGWIDSGSWSFMVLILAPSSLGLIVAVLKETHYTNHRLGQTILVAATIADFGTLIILSVVVALIESGGFQPEVLLVTIVFVGFVAAYLVLSRIYRQEGVQRGLIAMESSTSQVKLRFSFLLFLAFVAISQSLGAEIVLGTFLAGMLVSLLATKEDKDVVHQLESIGFGFFIPIFFIMIGVKFDLQALIDNPQALALVPILLIGAILVKLVPALMFRLVHSWRSTMGAGILLTARLSLIVAEAAIGVDLGIISQSVNADIILLAMILATIGPLVFTRMMPKPKEETAPPIVVVGANELGLEVAEQLRGHNEPVVIIDPNVLNVEMVRERGFDAVLGYADRPSQDAEPYLDKADRLVAAYAESDINYQICRYIKSTYGTEHVVSRVNNMADLVRFEKLGVTATNPAIDYAALLVMLTRSPAAYDLMTRTDDDQEVHEFVVRNHDIIGQSLRQISLPAGVLILAMQRDGELIVPTADTRLQRNDHVTIVGKAEYVDHAYEFFATE